MKRFQCVVLVAAVAAYAGASAAQQVRVEMNAVDIKGVGAPIGYIIIDQTGQGAMFSTNLTSLKPGEHGFHVHEFGNCGAKQKDGKMSPAEMAGDHYDPKKTHKHAGPKGNGHVGDLPPLKANANGMVVESVTAPHVAVKDIRGKTLMIHEGGDNGSDQPKPNGGGGMRVACGVIPAK